MAGDTHTWARSQRRPITNPSGPTSVLEGSARKQRHPQSPAWGLECPQNDLAAPARSCYGRRFNSLQAGRPSCWAPIPARNHRNLAPRPLVDRNNADLFDVDRSVIIKPNIPVDNMTQRLQDHLAERQCSRPNECGRARRGPLKPPRLAA